MGIDIHLGFSEELKKLIKSHKLITVQTGEYILIEGEYCPGIPLVVNGCVKIIKEDISGKEIVLYRINQGEGCIMSITSSMLNSPTEASAISETLVEMYLIPTETSHEWVKIYPEWFEFILKTTNHRYFDLVRLVSDVSFKSLSDRLLSLLDSKSNLTRDIKIQHALLANELGTAREVISRLLKAYERKGWVLLSRGRITLTNEFYSRTE